MSDFSAVSAMQRNCARLSFLEPAVRNLFDDLEIRASTCFASLRMEIANRSSTPTWLPLLGDLSVRGDGSGAPGRCASRGRVRTGLDGGGVWDARVSHGRCSLVRAGFAV
ncbi:hypothetical protein [Streptomyces sp. NPDC027717]|uniref:MmyB family transcriptional regulator n=1 Tax=Streptomyces sp. NPDC027717 TaxID=3155765 RepID=UPI0033CD4ED7